VVALLPVPSHLHHQTINQEQDPDELEQKATNTRTEKRAAPGIEEIRSKSEQLAAKTCREDHDRVEKLSRKNHRPIPGNPHLVQEHSFSPKKRNLLET
jgi:hypothetical protein